MIGSSVVEVEVDGETKYKVVFELEATEETVEAAQEEEEITRINNSLVLPVSCGNLKTSPIKRPRVRQDETHIIVQGTRHVLSRRPCIYTGGKIEDAKDFCLNRLAVFRRGRAGPARAGLPRGVDRAVKEVSGLPPARGACWQARVLIKTWAARPARHRRARRGPRGRVARPSARR